jgi:hypothetical protein
MDMRELKKRFRNYGVSQSQVGAIVGLPSPLGKGDGAKGSNGVGARHETK